MSTLPSSMIKTALLSTIDASSIESIHHGLGITLIPLVVETSKISWSASKSCVRLGCPVDQSGRLPGTNLDFPGLPGYRFRKIDYRTTGKRPRRQPLQSPPTGIPGYRDRKVAQLSVYRATTRLSIGLPGYRNTGQPSREQDLDLIHCLGEIWVLNNMRTLGNYLRTLGNLSEIKIVLVVATFGDEWRKMSRMARKNFLNHRNKRK